MQTDFAGMDKMRGITGGWTAGLMMIMISYYIAYNIFLLRKQKQQRMQGAN
jgi:cbb3-type cytochrome oxidase subunit 3